METLRSDAMKRAQDAIMAAEKILRRGFNRFLLGSISEAVAMHADCSVEVIR